LKQADETIKPKDALNGKLFRPLRIISVLMLFLSLFPAGVSGQLGGGHSVFIPAIMNGYGNTPLTDLGSIQYTLDTARQATATYKNDGNPVTLSVTDAQGYVWTLTIPNGALLWPQKITMTPFASMEVSQSVAKVRSGVMIGPEGLRFTPPVTFSGGEQQRVNIARGFLPERPILLLDEPTASLDAANRATVIELIAEKKRRGAAIVAIVHDDEVRSAIADSVVDVTRFSPAFSPARSPAA